MQVTDVWLALFITIGLFLALFIVCALMIRSENHGGYWSVDD
jgi:hypothetical protein